MSTPQDPKVFEIPPEVPPEVQESNVRPQCREIRTPVPEPPDVKQVMADWKKYLLELEEEQRKHFNESTNEENPEKIFQFTTEEELISDPFQTDEKEDHEIEQDVENQANICY